MAKWHPVARLSELETDEALGVEIEGRPLCIVSSKGEIFAIDDLCPHQRDIRLSEGYVEDGTIECPQHQACFDLRTGKVLQPPAEEDVATYSVRVDGDTVFVEL